MSPPHPRTTSLLATLLLATITPATADSDGYYCTGPGFVAYQFNGISRATDGHVLSVIRVGTRTGIAEPMTITLPSFQVHGMKCNHESVELRAWNAVHVVELSAADGLGRGPVVEIPQETRLHGFHAANLGDWSRAETVPIESTDPQHTYELVVRKREQALQPAGILHRTTTELVRRARTGEIVERRLLYEGTFEETVD